MPVIRIGLPKGSLQDSTFELMRRAGFSVSLSSRSYAPRVDDPEMQAMLARPQEVSRYVEAGVMDLAITGRDWVLENGSDVAIVRELVYSKQQRVPVRWVLAVAEDSPVRQVADLEGKRIATELVATTKRYLQQHGVTADVEFSWGATEAKVPDLVDAIVELTETGSSLKANNLRIVDTLLESVTVIIANRSSLRDAWKREKIESFAMLLGGALAAQEKVGLKLNIRRDHLTALLERLPAMRNPTVSALADEAWVAVETVVDESVVRTIIPELKKLGGEGIIEYPLNKVIP